MQPGSPSAFAQARAEIQLWPLAAIGYYLSYQYAVWKVMLFIVLLFTGAVSYQIHRILYDLVDQNKNFRRTFNKVSRKRRSQSSSQNQGKILSGLEGIWGSITPDSRALRWVVFLSLATNLFVGLRMFLWIGRRVIVEPGLAELGLIALPSLLIAAMLSAVIISR